MNEIFHSSFALTNFSYISFTPKMHLVHLFHRSSSVRLSLCLNQGWANSRSGKVAKVRPDLVGQREIWRIGGNRDLPTVA